MRVTACACVCLNIWKCVVTNNILVKNRMNTGNDAPWQLHHTDHYLERLVYSRDVFLFNIFGQLSPTFERSLIHSQLEKVIRPRRLSATSSS